MTMIPYVVAYVALGIFAVAVVGRFFMWQKMPLHVRWELYPVAHDPRADHGGSYLEDVDWWKKPRESSLVGEMKVMIPEILYLVALKEHNPKLWVRSFPFHFGIYLVIGASAMMMFVGLLGGLLPASITSVLGYLIQACAYVGLPLGALGALGLLQRRLADPELRDFSAPSDFFNLLFVAVAFGVAFASLLVPGGFANTLLFVSGLMTFSFAPMAGAGLGVLLPAVAVILMGALVAYIPMTHMSHFVGKFFAYHAIRWADEPNLRGGEHEAAIGEVLQRPVSWSAHHIGADGKKSWAELATEEVKQ